MEHALSRIPEDDFFEEALMREFSDGMGAKRNLYKLLATGGMWLGDILKPANSEGYSKSAYRIAASQLGVIKTQKKRDGIKDSWWRLPTEDDFD